MESIRLNTTGLLLAVLLTGCASVQDKPVVSKQEVVVPLLQPQVYYSVARPEKKCVAVAAVGDIMLGGSARQTLQENGYDYAFAGLPELGEVDITVGNLETALTERGTPFEKKYNFRNPPSKVIPALQGAGFDVVSLANNHTLDYGEEGLQDTLQALAQANIGATGAGNSLQEARAPYIVERNGQKIGFLAYSLTFPAEFWANNKRGGTAYGNEQHIRADVESLKQQVDAVIVQFHWGREGTTKLRDYQVALGRASIDAGAAVVLGHHPHVLQGIERYGDGVIYYSLGNFSFGSFSQRVQTGGVAQVQLCDGVLESSTLDVVDINNYRVKFQPVRVNEAALQKSFEHMSGLSKARNTHLTLEQGQIVVDLGSTTKNITNKGLVQ